MRKSMLLCLIPLLVISCVTAPVEKLQNKEVIDLQGMNKEEIFNKSNQWFAEKFGSANAIIQYKNLHLQFSLLCSYSWPSLWPISGPPACYSPPVIHPLLWIRKQPLHRPGSIVCDHGKEMNESLWRDLYLR